MNAIEQFDTAIRIATDIGNIAHYRDLRARVREMDRKVCGNCVFWMMSRQCPRETNRNGRPHGPSANELACDKFQITESTLRIKAERQAEADAFADKCGLKKQNCCGAK